VTIGELSKRLAPRRRLDEVLPEACEDRFEREKAARLVIDEKDVDFLFALRCRRGRGHLI
jgi:hypothetical protein